MRHGPALLIALLTLLLAAPAGAAAQSTAQLKRTLRQNMAAAGSSSGAYVLNADENRVLFRRRSSKPRVLASNTKIFTAAAALDRFGTEATLGTAVMGDGELLDDGTYRGNIYLRGAGDPTFGSSSFNRRNYPAGAPSVEQLAQQVERAGIERVTGRVYGDESRFDSRRGGPYSGYGTSIYVGPLSALSFNRGFANERGSSYQGNPPAFAAARFKKALKRRGVSVRHRPEVRPTPRGAAKLAQVESPRMDSLVRLMMKPSDNFFAEMLLKRLARAPASTRDGTRVAVRHARSLGVRVRMSDGSGLSRGNRASPKNVGKMLDKLRERDDFTAFERSLPIAGRDGTLNDRMRRGRARGRCRAKTGTLSNVSALSGYCRSRSGDTIVFSFLMNRVSPSGARVLQDRMTQALARYRG